MREPIMKITDHQSGEVYWLSNHDKAEAYDSFGQDIDIKMLWAIDDELINIAQEALDLLPPTYSELGPLRDRFRSEVNNDCP